jgi:hypothetical protein
MRGWKTEKVGMETQRIEDKHKTLGKDSQQQGNYTFGEAGGRNKSHSSKLSGRIEITRGGKTFKKSRTRKEQVLKMKRKNFGDNVVGKSGSKVVIKTQKFFIISPITGGIVNLSGRLEMIWGFYTMDRRN